MKKMLKRDMFPLSMILIYIILTIYLYGSLPESIPTHYGWNGSPDAYSSKIYVVLFSIGIVLFLYMIITFIPLIDPFWRKIEKKYSTLLICRDIVIAFLIYISAINLIFARGNIIRDGFMGIGFGLLFILLGNYMPRLPRNFFIGIRSPWTLASEEVWVKTHRISGVLFVIAGALIVVSTLCGIEFKISMLALVPALILFTAVIYPFLLFRKLKKEGLQKENDL